jgi:hypothetical protein
VDFFIDTATWTESAEQLYFRFLDSGGAFDILTVRE